MADNMSAENPKTPSDVVDASKNTGVDISTSSEIEPISIIDVTHLQLPNDPYNPDVNAKRARILTGENQGPLASFKENFAGIRESKRFNNHLSQYAEVLGIGGISPEDIRRFKIRLQRAYGGTVPADRSRLGDDLKRNLEILIEDRFDKDHISIVNLKLDAGEEKVDVDYEDLDALRKFKAAGRNEKIKSLRSMSKDKKGLLISNYDTYLKIWHDLNPDKVNFEELMAEFEATGSNKKKQLVIAEKMHADVSEVINQRALAYSVQWKQLSIDEGLSGEEADEKAAMLIQNATTGPMVSRFVNMQEIRGKVEDLLLETFEKSSKVFTEMNTGNLENQIDLDTSFHDPEKSVEDRIRFAKGLYRKIDRLLNSQSSGLFSQLAKQLRKDRGEKDVIFEIHRRESHLKSLSRLDQYRKIKEDLEALGLTIEPTPGMLK